MSGDGILDVRLVVVHVVPTVIIPEFILLRVLVFNV